MKQYLLIDIGGTFIKYSLADEQARKISGGKVPTPLTNMDDLLAVIEGFAAPLQGQFVGCAISMPGRIETRSGIAHTGGMLSSFMWEQPFAAQVEARLGVPVTIANDGKCAAAAEGWTGALAGVENGLVLVLGTGIGGGIIINGKIFAGFNYAGAELGHTVVVKGGRPCMCGRRGCWEKYASARALTEDTRAAMLANPDNMMWKLVGGDLTKVGAKTAFDALHAGDELAKTVVSNWIEYVACGITDVVNIFQPEVICIGGGVSAQGETLLGPIREYVDREEYARNGKKRTVIKVAELKNDAGVLGAASLGEQQMA